MANVSASDILARCREVIDGAYGVARTIASTRFTADFPADGLSQEEIARRAIVGPRFDVRIGALATREQAPAPMHSRVLYDLEVRVKISRTISTVDRLIDSTRDDTLALLSQDVDAVTQALGYPGNLTATEAGAATGILGGSLAFGGIASTDIRLDDAGNNTASRELVYTGTVSVSAEVANVITSPAQINAPLFAWYRSDLGVTTVNRSGTDYVSAWADQSAFDGYQDLTQGTAVSQPQYVASDALLNGHPSIAFTTDYVFPSSTYRNVLAASAASKASAAFMHGSGGCCVFLVCYHQNYSTGGVYITTFSGNDTVRNGFSIGDSIEEAPYFWVAADSVASPVNYSSPAVSLPFLTPACIVANVTEAALPRYYFRLNGVTLSSGLYTSAPSVLPSSEPLAIGASPTYLSGNLYGNIAEIAVYKGTLNSDQIALLEAYAATRYAL